MNIHHSHALALAAALLLPACVSSDSASAPDTPTPGASATASGTEVGNGMAPRYLAGSQLEYTNPQGKNVYTFFGDGCYRYATMSQNQTTAASREGKYTYRITAPGRAHLTFDRDPAIRLQFDSPLTATGTVEGDTQTYSFRVIRPDGE